MNNEFIPTANVERCRQMCEELESPAGFIGPSLGMITGRAGRGKTEFAKHFATNSTAIYVPPMKNQPVGMFLREITFELCKTRPHKFETCLRTIGDEMDKDRRLILVDEADNLPLSFLEMLRNINERFQCPVVLIGEEGLKGKVGSRRRLASRIRSHVEFAPVQQAEVKLFYKKALDADISPEVTAILTKACGGDWRPVLKAAVAIERAMHASGIEEISEALAKAVVNNGQRA